jgi:MFS family permease
VTAGRDRWLVELCVARTLLTSVFMTYAATLPVLRAEWGMSATAAGAVSTGFQLGYAVSLLVCSSLADRLGARRVFMASAWLSAAAGLVFALFARSWPSALLLYTLVGVSQGGTYTTAIMLFADRYPPERRGAAVGWLIAAISAGFALSLLVCGVALAWGGYPAAFHASAAGPLAGALLAGVALRGTPNVVHARRPGARFGTAVLRNGRAMRLIAGYTFHSWELLGMWAWVPAFLAAGFVVAGRGDVRATELGAYVAAALHVVGLAASTSMGRLSDALGRRSVLLALAATSAACSFAFGWLLGWPLAVVFAVGAVYAFTALGDSPVLSTGLTEAVGASHLGDALALRSLLGFGAGAIAPIVFGLVLDATNPPGPTPKIWGWAFASLGVAGLLAALCAWTLPRDRPGAAPARIPPR